MMFKASSNLKETLYLKEIDPQLQQENPHKNKECVMEVSSHIKFQGGEVWAVW